MKNQLDDWIIALPAYQYGEIKPGTMSNWEKGMSNGLTKAIHAMYSVEDTRDLQTEIMREIFDAKEEARKGKDLRAVTQAKAKEATLKMMLSYLECVEMVGSLEGQQP